MAGWGNIRGDRDPRPITSGVRVFVGRWDCGPCEPGAPSAFCPHCGSGGRYVFGFICDNGERRGAMKGCIKLFRMSRLAAEQLQALERFEKAAQEQRARGGERGPTSWDSDIMDVTDRLAHDQIEIEEACGRIQAALDARRAWLSRRFGKRRR